MASFPSEMYRDKRPQISIHYDPARYVFIITKWTDWCLEYLLQMEQI